MPLKILQDRFGPVTPREKKIRSITLWGALLNVVLLIIKIISGLLIRSSALIADGVHSLTDLATDLVILLGARLSNRPADETHPYGHRKFDTIASQLIAFILIAVGFGFVISAGTAIFRQEVNYPGFLMLAVATISVVSKEIIFHITRKISRITQSAALYANAWHHRSDSFSSMAVLIGGAAMDGPRYIWWNFVSSRKDRIEQAKAEWKERRFDIVPGDETEFIPLPER